jgi:hypothetical protein
MDKNYDDGLVHCHNWACGPETPADATKPQGAETTASTRLEHDSFDDGLVHSHDWARN